MSAEAAQPETVVAMRHTYPSLEPYWEWGSAAASGNLAETDIAMLQELREAQAWLYVEPEQWAIDIKTLRASLRTPPGDKELLWLLDPAHKYNFDAATEDEIYGDADFIQVSQQYPVTARSASREAMTAKRLVCLDIFLKRMIRLQKMGGTTMERPE